MIRTGEQYRQSIRGNREIFINGERVKDVTAHPMFKPLVDVRARIYDMAHVAALKPIMTYREAARSSRSASSFRTPTRIGTPSAARSMPSSTTSRAW